MLKEGMYYICSPLSAPTEEGIRRHMLQARHYMKLVSGCFHCRAVAPHAYLPELLDDRNLQERELGLRFGMELLQWCAGLIVCGKEISGGMKEEIKRAEERKIPVYFLLETPTGVFLSDFRREAAHEMPVC